MNDFSEIVQKFKANCNPCDRYASFDYCYNYFHPSNKNDLTKNIEKSCLAIGFYLASWGMFRGSSFMLEKSAKNFEKLIEYIAQLPPTAWEIDADNFNQNNNSDFLIEQYNRIKEILIKHDNVHLVLVTKIMLGVFASVPAYDSFFTTTLKNIFKKDCRFTSFNKKSLECIHKFYESNEYAISNIKNVSRTIDFVTGLETDLEYSNSKIIDMYGFGKSFFK